MRSGGHAVLAALALLLAGALLAGEDYFFWVGAAAVVAAGAALAAGLWGLLPRPVLGTAGVVALALLAAFALWSAGSILWSAAPDRSWEFLNRLLVYLAFLALGLFVGARGARRFADVLAALLGLLVGVALVVKVLALDDGRRARLNAPVDYWNTLALLAACAVPLALGLRSRLHSVLLLYGAVVAVLLAQSRGGLLLAGLAAVVWLALERGGRYEAALRLAVSVPVAVAVGAFGLSLSGISEDGRAHGERFSHGLWLGLALAVGAAVVAGLARLDVPEARRAVALRGALLVVAPLAALVLGVVAVRAAADFTEPVASEEPTRLIEASSNNRAQWWGEALRGFRDNPVAGNGAGAFQVTHRRYRESDVEVLEPHSLPLQLLSETGLVGFALLAGAAVAAGLAVRRERALVLVVSLFGIGLLYDIHWDLLPAGAVAFATLGVLLARGEREGRREPWWAAGAVALALASVYSLAAPWLAERRLDAAYAAVERGDLVVAADQARRARALNPTSVEPLFTLGFVEGARGQVDRAREHYARAVEVQPENREAWFQLGLHEFENERYADAYGRFNRMYELDPRGPHVEWVERARCELNPTGCP